MTIATTAIHPASASTAVPDRRQRISALQTLFSTQHGAASSAQIRGLGFTRSAIAHLVDTGTMARIGPGVFIACAAPDTWWRRVQVAALTCGVIAISHGTAARLHGFDAALRTGGDASVRRGDPVEILVGRGARPRVDDAVVVHRTRADPERVSAERVVRVGSIPTLDVGTVLCQLAEHLDAVAVRSALIATLRHGSLSERRRRLAGINDAVRWWRCRGRRGPQRIGDALAGLGLPVP